MTGKKIIIRFYITFQFIQKRISCAAIAQKYRLIYCDNKLNYAYKDFARKLKLSTKLRKPFFLQNDHKQAKKLYVLNKQVYTD